METSEKLQKTQVSCQISTLPVQVYPVLRSVSLEEGQKIPSIKPNVAVTCLYTFAKSYNLKNLAFFFLNKSKAFFRLANGKEKFLVPCLTRFQNWGTMRNGKLLTARIMVSHKTGNECSLSDILETNPDPKYFLSWEKLTRTLASRSQQKPQLLEQ